MRDFLRWTEINDCLRFNRVEDSVGGVSKIERWQVVSEILKFR
jgi:hypothetical protein